MSETKSLERLLDKTVKLYNKAIAQKGQGKTISTKSIDKKNEKDYDNTTQYSRRANEDGREEGGAENGSEGAKDVHKRERGRFGERGTVSYTDDFGRIRYLREVVGRGEIQQRIEKFAATIYTKPNNDTQETLRWHAKNEDLELYFVKRNETRAEYLRRTNNERSDEFRRIQEESLAMSDGELQLYRNGSKKLDGELRDRVVLVFRKEIHASRNGGNNSARLLKNTGEYSLYENVDPSLFHDCFQVVRQYLRYGELVDLHAALCYNKGKDFDARRVAKTKPWLSIFRWFLYRHVI